MTLIVEQPNVMQVFEFWEKPEPVIIMVYYPDGNIVDAGVINDESYVSALGQILDGLSHLHEKGVVHRDLKPENFLVEKKPFKIIITDFGLAKVVNNTTLLTTFCGTLKYLAPEVFPGLSDGHGPPVDVWSLGVIVLEWIYGVPAAPAVPAPKRKGTEVPPQKWYEWVQTWSKKLLRKLNDEDDGQVIEILFGMMEVEVMKRWRAKQCLAQGFKNGLFKRRVADGLVVCSRDPDELALPADGDDDGTKTPIAVPSPANIDPKATDVLGNMWGGESVNSPLAIIDGSSSTRVR